MTTKKRMRAVLAHVEDELVGAVDKFPPFNSAHEGFAVLKEEVDELWDEVKRKKSMRSDTEMQYEATQIAAMAVRFIIDVCDG